jgi:hypothetical protein
MTRFDGSAFSIERDLRALRASVAVLILGVALAASAPGHCLGLAVAWVGLGGVLYAWARDPVRTREVVHVGADVRGLFVDGDLVLPASQIADGWTQARARTAPLVHLRGRGARHLRFLVRDMAHARLLLRALEINATEDSAGYWALARPLGEPRAFAHVGALLGLALAYGLVGPSSPAALVLGLVATTALLAAVAVPTKVVVGTDGVFLRWLGTARFVPWSLVTAVEPFEGGVVLALARQDGLTLRMPADDERCHRARDALVTRMEAALRAFGPGAAHPPGRSPLSLAGVPRRPTRAWVREVRALARPVHDYRTASVPAERLWRLVEDPRADWASRTGAAVALACVVDPAGEARLRAAAAVCAEPNLRMALVTAVDEATASDEDLASALDAISPGEGELVPPSPSGAY